MGQCSFFDWHDDEFDERLKVVIRELLDHIDRLYGLNTEVQTPKNDFEVVQVEMNKIV